MFTEKPEISDTISVIKEDFALILPNCRIASRFLAAIPFILMN